MDFRLGLDAAKSEIDLDQALDAVIHVEGNDIMRVGSEEILSNYKKVLVDARRKGRNAFVTGIIPRFYQRWGWSSRALVINDRLEALFHRIGVGFINLWDQLYGRRELYARDGVHFSIVEVITQALDIELDRVDSLLLQRNY